MPRTENPVDPLSGPLAAFAHDLRLLREKAGRPPYRTLAKRAGFSASTLSVAASASVLPSLDVTLAYVQACGGDPAPWRERWQRLAAQPVRGEGAAPAIHEAILDEAPTADEIHVQLSVPAAAVAPAEPVTEAGRGRYGARRLFASLAMVTAVLAAFAVVAGAVYGQAMPYRAASADTVIRLQSGKLYDIILMDQPLHLDATASVDLVVSRDQRGERDVLIEAALVRLQQAEQVSHLDVSQIPDGPRMVQALHDFWTTRAYADMLYAISADNQGSNGPVIGATSSFKPVQEFEHDAQQSGDTAVGLWNSHATAMDQPQITELML